MRQLSGTQERTRYNFLGQNTRPNSGESPFSDTSKNFLSKGFEIILNAREIIQENTVQKKFRGWNYTLMYKNI